MGIYLLSIPAIANAEEPSISGSASFDINSHFMSYGADVWGAGSGADLLFQPSLGIAADFGNGFSMNTGVWFDINDQIASSLGGSIQEVDVWLGATWAFDTMSLDLTFQQWYYASETEGIVDLTLSFNTVLSPYVKAHNRIEAVGLQSRGTVIEMGAGYDFPSDGGVSFSIPFAVGIFADKNFQGGHDTFGYANVGFGFSVPMASIPESMGEWDFHGAATLWYTPDSAIPGNPDETFITLNLGVGVGF